MVKIRSWEVSDQFWKRVEPFIPKREREHEREFQRKPGGGRKPMSERRAFEAIVFVLRSGCQWKSLPRERFGSASSVHKYFRQWLKTGFFLAFGVPVLPSMTRWKESPGSGRVSMEP